MLIVMVYVYEQVLVLGNKVDLPNALRERDLIERMYDNLFYFCVLILYIWFI